MRAWRRDTLGLVSRMSFALGSRPSRIDCADVTICIPASGPDSNDNLSGMAVPCAGWQRRCRWWSRAALLAHQRQRGHDMEYEQDEQRARGRDVGDQPALEAAVEQELGAD